jgi:phosphate transport system substrate-binding protein
MYQSIALVVSILLPFALMFALIGINMVSRSIAGLIIISLAPPVIGYVLAKRLTLPKSLFSRFWPLFAPGWLLLLAFNLYVLFVAIPGLYEIIQFSVLYLLVYLFYWLSFAIVSERRSPSDRNGSVILLIFGVLFAVSAVNWGWGQRDIVESRGFASVGHGVDTSHYLPFYPDNTLAKPAQEPSLAITADYPRLDGAIALLPVYGAAAQAVYKNLDDYYVAEKYVQCTNTPSAYRRLIDGEADIFFGVGPSSGQKEYAQSKGVALTRTPIAREAFVFLTHKDNPVGNLTLEQIRAIYTKKITHWREVGGDNEKIMAFQRPDDSGSQTTMKEMVMQGRSMARPLKENISSGMGDMILAIADYQNRKNALGYSFRWYATVQYSSSDIKLLSVNGVSPTPENIQSGRYPLTVDFEAVTARPLSPESREFIDWLVGSEGQDLINRTGYTPVN